MGGFTATNLSSPPPPPPDVAGQQGGNPMSGISEALAGKLGKKEEGSPEQQGAHPQGAMLALLETLKKSAQQLARMDAAMAPFVNRALGILEQGVGEVISKKKPEATPPEPGSKGGMDFSTRPSTGETSKGFPG
jgi:hypothetical protein